MRPVSNMSRLGEMFLETVFIMKQNLENKENPIHILRTRVPRKLSWIFYV